jgi:uncharacterized membrane protein HdeD (DUF308 family)
MSISLQAASEVMREAMRDTVRRFWFWYLLQGVLMIGAGVLALIHPVASSLALVVFLGWLLIAAGIVQGFGLIGARSSPYFWLHLLSVALFVVVGVLFLRDPAQSLMTLTVLLIVFFVVEGISKIVFALTIRPFPHWGWVLLSGVVGIALAFYLWSRMPVTAVWFLGALLGISLVSEGAALAYLAWQVRRTPVPAT